MQNENLVDDYLQAPEVSYEEALAAARARQTNTNKQKARLTAKLNVREEMQTSWIDSTFAARQEADDSVFDNTKEVLLTAGETAAEQIARSIGNLGEGLTNFEDNDTVSLNSHIVFGDGEFLGDIGFKIPFTDTRLGFVPAAKFERLKDLFEISTGDTAATLSNFEIDDVDRPDSPAGEFGANMIKWLTVFAATRKAMGTAGSTAGNVSRGFAAGAVTDFSVFDPHEERLSNLLQDMGKGDTVFNNAVTNYLAADKLDSDLEGRLKNAVEGAVIGGMVDGLFSAIKWLRVRQRTKAYDATQVDEPASLVKDVEDIADEVIEAEARTVDEEISQSDLLTDVDPVREATPESVAKDALDPPPLHETVQAEFKLKAGLSDEAVEVLARNIQDGNLSEATKMVNFNEARIDWDNMDDRDSLQQLFYAFEDAAGDMLQEAAGGHVSHKTTKTIAESVGFTAENAHNLFGTLRQSGGISARMFAAQQSMVASGRHMIKLAKAAKETGANEDVFKLHRHIELHAALMAQVKGSQSEIARALSAMRMMKDATAETFREFDQVKDLMGGHKNTDAIIDDIIDTEGSLNDLNKSVIKTTGQRVQDVIAEVAINGLLSSVKTHVINTASNAGMLVVGPMERYLTVAIGKFSKAQTRVSLREANAAMIGQLNSVTKAWRLAVQAAKEGRPISDLRQRVEFDARKAIRSETTGKTGTDLAIAKGINFLGETIRLPGRALLAGDEFFKTINKESELYAQAYRLATNTANQQSFKSIAEREGFIKAEMGKLIESPSVAMEAQAIQFSRRQTFQESAETAFGPKVEALLNFNPIFKLIVAPFVRTPMNLLRQSFVDRNPLLFAVVEKNRKALAKGGPEAHAIVARTVTGIGAWMTAYGLVQSGVLTGKGENFTNTEKLDKIPEYSIKIGDRFYSYNRLDPLGSMFGLVADMDFAFRHGYDPDDPQANDALMELSQAVGVAFMQNALNKTWMRSLSDLMETATTLSEGSSASAQRAADKFIADQLIKATPFSSAIRGFTQSVDPVVREAWTIRDRVFRNLPGLSYDLPPVRDLLGRQVTRANAEWFWINPFGANPESDNPIDRELSRLSFDSGFLAKQVNGVQLTSEQYSEFKRLIGDLDGNGPTFEEQLKVVFESRAYQKATDSLRVQLVKNLLTKRKETAKQLLISRNDNELRNQITDVGLRRQERLSGEKLDVVREQLGLE